MSDRYKILVVCSRNQRRSPTAENIYRDDPRIVIHSCGTHKSARHFISHTDISWADMIMCMEQKHAAILRTKFYTSTLPPIRVLDIEDSYRYMDPELIELLRIQIEIIIQEEIL